MGSACLRGLPAVGITESPGVADALAEAGGSCSQISEKEYITKDKMDNPSAQFWVKPRSVQDGFFLA